MPKKNMEITVQNSDPAPIINISSAMNPDPKTILDPILRADALVSATLNFAEIDRAPEDVLNRIIWRSVKGSKVPYPDWAVTAVEEDEEEEERERLLKANKPSK